MNADDKRDLILGTIFERVGKNSIQMKDLQEIITQFDINSMCGWLQDDGYLSISTHLRHIQLTEKGEELINNGGVGQIRKSSEEAKDDRKANIRISKCGLSLLVVSIVIAVISMIIACISLYLQMFK